MQKIAIENDIYLATWIHTLKPIVVYDNMYMRFLANNTWVPIGDVVYQENTKYILIHETDTRLL